MTTSIVFINLSRDIIRDRGGTIIARSRPAQGAALMVWLPEYEALA